MVKEKPQENAASKAFFLLRVLSSRRYYLFSKKNLGGEDMPIGKGKFSSHSLSPRDPLLALISAPTIGISNRRDAPKLQVTANRGRPDQLRPGIMLA